MKKNNFVEAKWKCSNLNFVCVEIIPIYRKQSGIVTALYKYRIFQHIWNDWCLLSCSNQWVCLFSIGFINCEYSQFVRQKGCQHRGMDFCFLLSPTEYDWVYKLIIGKLLIIWTYDYLKSCPNMQNVVKLM